MKPALPTGTQGEERIHLHRIGVPSPFVGRLGTSGEPGSHQQFCKILLHHISLYDAPRALVNQLLLLVDYSNVFHVKVPRDKCTPWNRYRVSRSSSQVTSWSARRVRWTSVAELEVDLSFQHFSLPKEYPFPALHARKIPPSPSEWTSRLVSPAQIAALYAQEHQEKVARRIISVSFPSTGWVDQLATLYLEFEDRKRQSLCESTHAVFITREQRASDPELAQIW